MTKCSFPFPRNIMSTTLRALLCFTLIRSCCPRNPFSDIDLSSQTLNPVVTGFKMTGNAVGDCFGYSVSTAGDINNDGYDDIIVGADGKSSLQGAAYVIYGGEESSFLSIDFSTTSLDPLTTGFMISGNAAGDYFGYSVSTAGDINNDGYDDIIVGAPRKSSFQGAAYVIYGGPKSAMSNIVLSSTALNPTSTGFMVTGNAVDNYLGFSVKTAGDINNDGYDDIIIGAYGKNSNQGAAYVIYGGEKSSMSNLYLSIQTLDPLATGFLMTGYAVNDEFGNSVSTAGDINNDGYDDIIVGAHGKNNNQGAVYVIYGGGKSSMTNIYLSSVTLDPLTTGFIITGDAVGDNFGSWATPAGDFNNDGFADIIIGAYSKGVAYLVSAGILFLFFQDLMTNIAQCTTFCNQCSSLSGCTECKNSYYLYLSECLSSCPKATFTSTDTCKSNFIFIFHQINHP